LASETLGEKKIEEATALADAGLAESDAGAKAANRAAFVPGRTPPHPQRLNRTVIPVWPKPRRIMPRLRAMPEPVIWKLRKGSAKLPSLKECWDSI